MSPPLSRPTREFLGTLIENYEPIAWAEETIELALSVDHPRSAFLYVIASMCWVVGRIEAAVAYSDAGQTITGNDCDKVPFGIQSWLGTAVQHHRTARAVG